MNHLGRPAFGQNNQNGCTRWDPSSSTPFQHTAWAFLPCCAPPPPPPTWLCFCFPSQASGFFLGCCLGATACLIPLTRAGAPDTAWGELQWPPCSYQSSLDKALWPSTSERYEADSSDWATAVRKRKRNASWEEWDGRDLGEGGTMAMVTCAARTVHPPALRPALQLGYYV